MNTAVRAGWRLLVFAAAMLVVLALIVTAIRRPVAGETTQFQALFTDANGLKTGDDVRMYGVQVGKVKSIRLQENLAAVDLDVENDSAIYDNSRFAIRYQNLTGQRYVDIQQAATPGTRTSPGTDVGTDRTVPSYDVTSLFNGLEPVLSTLSPEALNRFGESMLAVIDGNGSGIGPALDAIGQLSSYVSDRQAVISTLVRNLAEISDRIGGRSPQLVTLLAKLSDVFESLQVKIDGLIDFALTAPPVLDPIDRLLATAGLTEQRNPDLDALLRTAFPNPQDILDMLSRLPGVVAGLGATLPGGGAAECGRGAADIPAPLAILVAGQQVTICRR